MAYAFLNYLSLPETAAANMDFIGYTSAIAGDAVFDQIDEWYGVEEGDEGYTVDLTYFFDGTLSQDRLTNGRAVVTVAELGRSSRRSIPPRTSSSAAPSCRTSATATRPCWTCGAGSRAAPCPPGPSF